MDQHYRALLIGNAFFPADQALPRLDGPQNDILAVRDALLHPEYGMFDPGEVAMLAERTSHELGRQLEGFFREADRDDVLLLYYSGHGKLDEHGNLLLCGQDTRLDRLISTAVSSDRLNAMIAVSVARAIIIILDCCYSGAFKSVPDIVAPVVPSDGRGRFVMAACRARELAADAMGPRHLSPFTHHLVAGLTGQVAKTTEEGFVSLDDLYRYVHSEMRNTRGQVPVRRGAYEGTIQIARSVKRRMPLSVAPKVIHIVDVEPDEVLPVERIRVRGLLPGDFWTATTEVRWIQITRLDEQVELQLTPQPVKSRANVEIVNNDTGELRVVRIIVRPTAIRGLEVGFDTTNERLRSQVKDLIRPVEDTDADAARAPLAEPSADRSPDDARRVIDQFVKRVPGVRQAILVTDSGLADEARGPMGRDDLDRLAAAVGWLRNAGKHLATLTTAHLQWVFADLDAGVVTVTPVAGGSCVGLYTTADADLGVAAYETAKLAHTLADHTRPPTSAARAQRSGNAATVESKLSWVLDELVSESGGRSLVGCVVASIDGIALATNHRFPFDATFAAAVACSLLASCRAVSAQMNAGEVRQATVATSSGYCLVTPFSDRAVLLQLLTDRVDLASSYFEAMRLAKLVGYIAEAELVLSDSGL
ncbi:caspase, EACC1-associated type [Rugosimonospora africana]|uniref:Roadblock/LAMTOR2 domain-containing protein n=1 Tax=Rugosimonospora africana TaxID=556532 RepID=A0A8J3QRI3_9ACTN|nr:caspase family protein [Rugosimonospora africana]GIH16140.1 hypothetical protein Raf01_43120 [Rugosimonospora africana]